MAGMRGGVAALVLLAAGSGAGRAQGLPKATPEGHKAANALLAACIKSGGLRLEGKGADAFRKIVLDKFDMSLGAGLGKLADKIFRIGHLGETNDLTLMGALSGVETGLHAADVPQNIELPVIHIARVIAQRADAGMGRNDRSAR